MPSERLPCEKLGSTQPEPDPTVLPSRVASLIRSRERASLYIAVGRRAASGVVGRGGNPTTRANQEHDLCLIEKPVALLTADSDAGDGGQGGLATGPTPVRGCYKHRRADERPSPWKGLIMCAVASQSYRGEKKSQLLVLPI
jgi:hypothetical protein